MRHTKKYKTQKRSRSRKRNPAKNQIEKGTSTFNKQSCAPKSGKINDYTCYTDQSLIDLKHLWNRRHPGEPIKTECPKKIHQILTGKMHGMCNRESCWLNQKFVDSGGTELTTLKLNTFRPRAPKSWDKNPNEWLSNLDIGKVMKQYEAAYKCFEFIGPTPIDFDSQKKETAVCVWEKLCNFSMEDQLKRGKTKIGVIFNTHPHDKSGEHWISLFINIRKRYIFFYDSVGDPMPTEIKVLINRITKQGEKLSTPINFDVDSTEGIEHQQGGTECGMYSLYFIIHMLVDCLSPTYIKNHVLTDEYMQSFRKKLFRYEQIKRKRNKTKRNRNKRKRNKTKRIKIK
jgi:hypothetical protein